MNTDDINPMAVVFDDVILDRLGAGKDYPEDDLLTLLAAWRADVDAEPITPMEITPTAA